MSSTHFLDPGSRATIVVCFRKDVYVVCLQLFFRPLAKCVCVCACVDVRCHEREPHLPQFACAADVEEAVATEAPTKKKPRSSVEERETHTHANNEGQEGETVKKTNQNE